MYFNNKLPTHIVTGLVILTGDDEREYGVSRVASTLDLRNMKRINIAPPGAVLDNRGVMCFICTHHHRLFVTSATDNGVVM